MHCTGFYVLIFKVQTKIHPISPLELSLMITINWEHRTLQGRHPLKKIPVSSHLLFHSSASKFEQWTWLSNDLSPGIRYLMYDYVIIVCIYIKIYIYIYLNYVYIYIDVFVLAKRKHKLGFILYILNCANLK